MLKSNFEFEVLIHGSSTKEYYHNGSYYIEGKKGSTFSIRMKNNSNKKALFVPTVDGLSVISGKEGSFKSQGYIVSAYDSITIDGWRTSDSKVSQFFFSSPEKSYAVKIDKGGNLGVIGCVVYREKEKEPIQIVEKIFKEYIPYIPWTPSINDSWNVFTSSTPSPSATSCSYHTSSTTDNSVRGNNVNQLQGLGTGFGEDKYSPITKVEFEREDSPKEVFSLFYNTKENLEKIGVEFKKPVYVAPSAFPNEEGYCKRPE